MRGHEYAGVMPTVAAEKPNQPHVLEMLRLSDEYALSLYPADSCYMLNVSELEQPGTTLFVARDDNTQVVGIAAIVLRGDGSAELKRMFVLESARGQGIAGSLLAAVEAHAVAHSVTVLQLETGPKQLAAIALYEKSGYAHIPNFGPYIGDEFSVCMEKRLG